MYSIRGLEENKFVRVIMEIKIMQFSAKRRWLQCRMVNKNKEYSCKQGIIVEPSNGGNTNFQIWVWKVNKLNIIIIISVLLTNFINVNN